MSDFKNQHLTEQDGDCLKEIFDLFDSDKDGKITVDDLDKVDINNDNINVWIMMKQVMRSHGYVHSSKELEEMILRLDKNFSGSVGFEEFLELEVKKEEVVEDDIVQVKLYDNIKLHIKFLVLAPKRLRLCR